MSIFDYFTSKMADGLFCVQEQALIKGEMIAGSLIRAGDGILCQHIGNLAGGRNRFSVGYPPHSPESWNQLKTGLAETKSIIKKLLANMADLRRKGSRISEMEKSVLERLVEHRADTVPEAVSFPEGPDRQIDARDLGRGGKL